jgi:hypothetical protein
MMSEYRAKGDVAAWRGVFRGRLWAAHAVYVVHDSPQETVLLLMPGAECALPEGYWRWGHDRAGADTAGARWDDALSGAWRLRRFEWQTNRLLLLMRPGDYFGTFHMWQGATGSFQCYYVNFQLPFQRSRAGFDSLDLDLDLIVEPDYTWHWKDVDDYRAGITRGGIEPAWVAGVTAAQPSVQAAVASRQYPFDGTWLAWQPPAEWGQATGPPTLPEGWETI